MRRFFALALLASTACAPADVGSAEEPIINGSRETGYPEVVAVYWSSGATSGGLCTGTVIGPYAILTAKHCVFEETASGYVAVDPVDFLVLVGDDINTAAGVTEVHYVSEVRTTPGSDVNFDVENGTDIAIVLLRDRIDIPPRAVATSGPSSGDAVTIVGFGQTSATVEDSAGVKYSGTMFVDRVGMRQIGADGSSWTCHGDSGGPMIDPSGAVTGITSFGFGDCSRSSYSVFVRTAAFRSLITDALAFVPPCEPTSEICNGIDDDCDGTADDGIGCLPVGSACTESAQCLRSTCEDVGGARICTGTCFIDAPRDCPEGLYCQVNGCGIGLCAPGAAGAGAAGAPCTADADCASSYCAPLRGGNLCGAPCCPDGGIFCGDGTLVCDPVPGGDGRGACIPPELAMGPRTFGSPCMANEDCLSGRCADPGEYCTAACDAATPCPGGYHCAEGFCVAGELSGTGGPCSTAGDCRDGATCFEGACAGACDPAAPTCPEGFVCTTTDAGNLCARPGTPLGEACGTNEECRSGICTGVGCTIICDTISCPDGYECRPAGTVSGCFRPSTGGGCSAHFRGRPGESGPLVIGLALLSLAVLYRRRRPSA